MLGSKVTCDELRVHEIEMIVWEAESAPSCEN
jgi:hypothetical protein